MSDESLEEAKEKATVLNHIAVSVLPENDLAPWMSQLKKPEIAIQIYMRTASDAMDMLGKEAWRLDHPEQAAKKDDDEYDTEQADGAAWAYAFCAGKMAQHVHNLAPSEGGLRTRQAISFGMAQKSGVALEPKKRSAWEKITGRGKDKEQVSGGV